MKRFINHLLGLNNLRKFCGNAAVFGRFREKYRLKIIDKPKKGKALVLAPHPDDDVFGCGGSLALHVAQGDEVKIIYLAGNDANKFSIFNFQFSIKEGGAIDRREEAENAAKILKVSDIEFWGLRDNEFTADKKNIARLKKVIEDYRPDIIYCPSLTDTNHDHFEVSKILYSVIASDSGERGNLFVDSRLRGNDKSLSILLYEVWTPIFVNRLIKIDSVMKQKKAAIKCHKSQLKNRSYFDAIIGLNQYRAGMFNAGKFAEAFTELDSEMYLKLFDIFCLSLISRKNKN